MTYDILLILSGSAATIFFVFALKIAFSNKAEYEKNHLLSKSDKGVLSSIRSVFSGHLNLKMLDSSSDATRVMRGLSIDKSNNWVRQSAVSDEALNSTFDK